MLRYFLLMLTISIALASETACGSRSKKWKKASHRVTKHVSAPKQAAPKYKRLVYRSINQLPTIVSAVEHFRDIVKARWEPSCGRFVCLPKTVWVVKVVYEITLDNGTKLDLVYTLLSPVFDSEEKDQARNSLKEFSIQPGDKICYSPYGPILTETSLEYVIHGRYGDLNYIPIDKHPRKSHAIVYRNGERLIKGAAYAQGVSVMGHSIKAEKVMLAGSGEGREDFDPDLICSF